MNGETWIQTERIVLSRSIYALLIIFRFSECIQDKNNELIGLSYFDDQYDSYQTAECNTDSISDSMFNNIDPFSIQAIINTTAAKYSDEITRKVRTSTNIIGARKDPFRKALLKAEHE